jgi:hypothetical protein
MVLKIKNGETAVLIDGVQEIQAQPAPALMAMRNTEGGVDVWHCDKDKGGWRPAKKASPTEPYRYLFTDEPCIEEWDDEEGYELLCLWIKGTNGKWADNILVLPAQTVYLMNDKGQTIDRL